MTQGKERPLKWIQNELQSLLEALKSNEDIIYIGELFENKDYTRFRYSEWVKKYEDDKIVRDTSHAIKDILENRVIK
jgi:hypothetical protein